MPETFAIPGVKLKLWGLQGRLKCIYTPFSAKEPQVFFEFATGYRNTTTKNEVDGAESPDIQPHKIVADPDDCDIAVPQGVPVGLHVEILQNDGFLRLTYHGKDSMAAWEFMNLDEMVEYRISLVRSGRFDPTESYLKVNGQVQVIVDVRGESFRTYLSEGYDGPTWQIRYVMEDSSEVRGS